MEFAGREMKAQTPSCRRRDQPVRAGVPPHQQAQMQMLVSCTRARTSRLRLLKMQDLNPFVPAETSQYAPASRRIQQAKPTAAEAMAAADFRNVGFLARFMTDTGRIVARRRSGLQVGPSKDS